MTLGQKDSSSQGHFRQDTQKLEVVILPEGKPGECTTALTVTHVGESAALEGCCRPFAPLGHFPDPCTVLKNRQANDFPTGFWWSQEGLKNDCHQSATTTTKATRVFSQSRETFLLPSPLNATLPLPCHPSARLFSPKDRGYQAQDTNQSEPLHISAPLPTASPRTGTWGSCLSNYQKHTEKEEKFK